MENNDFWNKLTQAIELPFDPEEVENIESNAGSVWIDLKDGRSFYILIDECEPLEQEEL